jgi:hypothetical protein
VPEVGTGGPTWSRATKAWGFNELGYLEELASGCAFFGGARLVRNICDTKSEDFTNAAWTKTALTAPSANLLVCANSTTGQSVININNPGVTAIGDVLYFRYRVQYIDIRYVAISGHILSFGTGVFCNFDLVGKTVSATGCTGTITEVSPGVFDIAIRATATSSAVAAAAALDLVNSLSSVRKEAFVGNGVKSIGVLRYSSHYVTNYNISYVPPYVSVGVEAAPFFGAGIDGAKYFETDWQGAPIAAANLLGFRREAAATNNLLHSRDLSNAAWSTKTNITAAKTATGLDGIANTATTLTASAADAIILQPTSGIASAARCASAYVKRRTGTGTISFTQDGTNWTDITSQINGSTWSRVQITSTLANPSVGFKISTSGDAIDVDCVQNEAGAVATSPIVTTTAAVTRDADSLTYQTSGNWSDTVGTAYVEVEPLAYSGGAIGSATNGLLLSTSNSGATAFDGTNAANGPTGTPGTSEKLALNWTGAVMEVASSATVGTPGTYDGAMGLSNIGIGVGASGYFKNVAVYPYALSDADMVKITT